MRGTSRPVSRRAVLRSAGGAGLGGTVLAGLLSGCTKPTMTASALVIPSPAHPVRWPITSDNEPIADGLAPESGPLLVYNYSDYLSPKVIKAFEREYGVDVQLTTYNDQDEAAQKIRTGEIPYDLYFPGYDSLGRLIQAGLVRPLNHSYLSNIDRVWSSFTDPWYDEGWQYTVPYTIYTTGVAWRTDRVKDDVAGLANPYASLWDPTYQGQVAVIDDWHTAMSMVALREGITDVNTGSDTQLARISDGLRDLARATNPRVTSAMYTQLPAGQLGLTQMWSGDVVNAQYYLPKGQSVDVLRYWFPTDGLGLIDNDMMVVLRGGKCPVLAHLFLQFLLDQDNALTNFGFTGYQPPQRVLDPERLVSDGYLPANLASAAVHEDWFGKAYRILQLDTTTNLAWNQVWQQFTAGAW